jgi:hypothetical protein
MIAAALALGLVAVSVLAAGAGDTAAAIAPYLQARDQGRIGVVTGEAFAEPSRPTGAPTPYPEVSVMLVPSDPGLESELDRVRRAIRESPRAYFAAAAELRALREAYERELVFAGGGELVRGEVSAAAGRFRFADVPAGTWLLLAWREVPHAVSPRRVPLRDAETFVGNTETKGYAAVELWRQAVEVRPGESTGVRLHDRNVWVTVVSEQRHQPVKTPAEGPGGIMRRQGTTPR